MGELITSFTSRVNAVQTVAQKQMIRQHAGALAVEALLLSCGHHFVPVLCPGHEYYHREQSQADR